MNLKKKENLFNFTIFLMIIFYNKIITIYTWYENMPTNYVGSVSLFVFLSNDTGLVLRMTSFWSFKTSSSSILLFFFSFVNCNIIKIIININIHIIIFIVLQYNSKNKTLNDDFISVYTIKINLTPQMTQIFMKSGEGVCPPSCWQNRKVWNFRVWIHSWETLTYGFKLHS